MDNYRYRNINSTEWEDDLDYTPLETPSPEVSDENFRDVGFYFGTLELIGLILLLLSSIFIVQRISNRLCPGSDWYRRGPWNDWSGGGGSRPGIGDDERSLDDLEILLVGLEEQQKQELLASVLASKPVSKEDIEMWKSEQSTYNLDDPEGTSKDEVVCPICITDFEEGDEVVHLTTCEHKFHVHCLSQWLSRNKKDCPYCRKEILTKEMIEEAHVLRKNLETV